MKDRLDEFYRSVDAAAARLEDMHAERLKCAMGCSSCCVDGITVFQIEADNISRNHSRLLSGEQPHSEGACAFLDKSGACRIYENRPYVCRTQGLPLRWIEVIDEEVTEYRDICPLNEDENAPIELIEETECWTIGEFEGILAMLQARYTGTDALRVPLRSLFSGSLKK